MYDFPNTRIDGMVSVLQKTLYKVRFTHLVNTSHSGSLLTSDPLYLLYTVVRIRLAFKSWESSRRADVRQSQYLILVLYYSKYTDTQTHKYIYTVVDEFYFYYCLFVLFARIGRLTGIARQKKNCRAKQMNIFCLLIILIKVASTIIVLL